LSFSKSFIKARFSLGRHHKHRAELKQGAEEEEKEEETSTSQARSS
jgi:hypothetical protein